MPVVLQIYPSAENESRGTHELLIVIGGVETCLFDISAFMPT
jgi:hypothetical protein